MSALLGSAAIATAFVLACWGVVAAAAGARRGSAGLLRSARAAAYIEFVLLAAATVAMVYALVARDFSVEYVAQVGSRSTPLWVTIVSLWSSLEGSILFWGLVLAAYSASAVYFAGDRLGRLGGYATATLHGIAAFFFLLLLGPANPFSMVSPAPLDGPGPNPLLQNHVLMAVHPPLLYLGYVGMSVPFAFAIGALLSGRLDDAWLRFTRRWTMVAWSFLSLAIMAGMWWSYNVLGWGGWWAWDPVENASFMPWLTATAFIHSAMVQERRGMLRVWNLALIVATFLLTILGTFLTRSGVLSSVHAFSNGPIGVYFLSFIAVVLVFALVLLSGRSEMLKSEGRLNRPLSRETAFLTNNLLFTAFTFTVLLGTLFPLIAEAARGVRVTVGAPFFNEMTLPICMALLFLLGVGPVLPWRGGAPELLRGKLLLPSVALLVTAGLCLVFGVRNVYAILAFGFAAFALTSNVQEFAHGAAARRRAHGEAPHQALYRLVVANNRRYGGYIAHIGIVLAAIGMAGSGAFRSEREVTLAAGESATLVGYTIRFDELTAHEEPHRDVVTAHVTAFRDGAEIGRMEPRINFYAGRDPVTTPAVRSRPNRDLYIDMVAFDGSGGSATFSIIVEPLVLWIWAGGLIVGLGGAIAAWPRRRRAIARGQRERAPAVPVRA